MKRSDQLPKWTVILLAMLIVGYFVFDKIVLSPQRQAALKGSVTLAWAAPTEYEDQSPLTGLAGYIIHYGTQAGQYTNTIYVDDPQTTNYQFECLSPGTYYFAIKAVNTDGTESALSNIMARTVP